jgi:hypothetical protein
MTYETLLDDAFLLATGKSRTSAKRSRRYKALLADSPHVPYTTRDEVAEMLLLGERIADRAFATLPAKLRRLAASWQSAGHDGQVEILREVKRVLGDQSLAYREAHQSKRFNVNESLPDQYGRWGQGNLRPNCLGMAQILIGFARATGAPHMMIDAIRSYSMHSDEFRYRAFRELIAILEPYRDDRSINKISGSIEQHCKAILKFLAKEATDPQAHVLLSIRTDNEWWLLDPYLDVCCKDDYRQKVIDRFYAKETCRRPSSTATLESYDYTKEVDVRCHIKSLREHLPYLNKLDRPRAEWSFEKEGYQFIFSSLAGCNLPGQAEQETYNVRIIDTLLHCVYPSHVYRRMLDEKSERLVMNEDFFATFKAKIDGLDRTKRIRNQAFKRLVQVVIRSTYLRIFDVMVGSDSPPTIREYLHPTMQLAIRTLNQLAVHRAVDAPQLIKFGSSQWVVYNMLGAVERSGNKRLMQILAKRVRHHAKYPWSVLPELRPYLPDNTGENHGNA